MKLIIAVLCYITMNAFSQEYQWEKPGIERNFEFKMMPTPSAIPEFPHPATSLIVPKAVEALPPIIRKHGPAPTAEQIIFMRQVEARNPGVVQLPPMPGNRP